MNLILTETLEYPVTVAQFRLRFPNKSFPTTIVFPLNGYAEVATVAQPAYDADTQTVVEGAPSLVGDQWTQTWGIVALSPAAARIAEIDSAIAGDTTLAQLKIMTTAEFDVWWTANVTNLAQAGAVLKRLARVVIRRVL